MLLALWVIYPSAGTHRSSHNGRFLRRKPGVYIDKPYSSNRGIAWATRPNHLTAWVVSLWYLVKFKLKFSTACTTLFRRDSLITPFWFSVIIYHLFLYVFFTMECGTVFQFAHHGQFPFSTHVLRLASNVLPQIWWHASHGKFAIRKILFKEKVLTSKHCASPVFKIWHFNSPPMIMRKYRLAKSCQFFYVGGFPTIFSKTVATTGQRPK